MVIEGGCIYLKENVIKLRIWWAKQNVPIKIIILSFTFIIITNILVIIPNRFIDTDNDWIAYYGGFLGAIIGGLVTYYSVKITIQDGEEKYKLTVRPYLETRLLDKKIEGVVIEYTCSPKTSANKATAKIIENWFIVRNIGFGPAIDIRILSSGSMKQKRQNHFKSIITQESAQLHIEVKLSQEDSMLSEMHFQLDFAFKDILGDYYSQEMSFVIMRGQLHHVMSYAPKKSNIGDLVLEDRAK